MLDEVLDSPYKVEFIMYDYALSVVTLQIIFLQAENYFYYYSFLKK